MSEPLGAHVGGEGPVPAKIMLIGESPGDTEVKEGRPFVGVAGRILDGILIEVGIKREQCYVTNLVDTQPAGNDFGRFYLDTGRSQPGPLLIENIGRLQDEIAQVKPHVIVALGAEPLKWLAGCIGIEKWRGSVMAGVGPATGYKVIGTFHPAAISREWGYRVCAVVDLGRAREQAAFPEIRQRVRTYYVARDMANALQALAGINKESINVSFDIETATNEGVLDVSAIALTPSHRPDWAICIPFFFKWGQRFWTPDEEITLWDALREILTNDGIGKIAHNGSYDIDVIERVVGFRVGPFVFDTMLAFHALQLELPKGLDFLTSWYTDHPYYKFNLKTKDATEFFHYNATDACVTYEIALKLMAELQGDGLWDFYARYLHALWEPLHEMQLRGVRFDYLRRNTLKKRFQEEIATLQGRLNEAVGHELNINSPKQMKEWLYGELKLKVKTKRRKGSDVPTVAADEEALEALYKESGNDALRLVLKIREKSKILSTYLEVKLDEDHRIRCSWCIAGAGKGESTEGGTETGRLSSRKTARGTGGNLQNVPAGIIRGLFIPDEGKVFINADLSQAEARLVAYLSDESRLIRVFEEGGDIHRRNAANIFKVDECDVPDNLRQLAKRVVHASNYGMGPITFARQCDIPAADARRLLNQYHATYPGIQNWHRAVQSTLRKRRCLETPFGRRRWFWGRWGEDLFKEAYAYVPQSTVADIVNQALIDLTGQGYEVLINGHDALLVQVDASSVVGGVDAIRAAMTRPLTIGRRVLTIPVDIKIGESWEALKKYEPPALPVLQV